MNLECCETDRSDTSEVRQWHPLIRTSAGVFVASLAAASAVFSSVLIVDPQTANPTIARLVGIAMVLVSLWLISTGLRLIANRPDHGGLLSPLVLRLVSAYMILFPPFAIAVSFKNSEWSMLQNAQAFIYLLGGIGLWKLASSRSLAASELQPRSDED